MKTNLTILTTLFIIIAGCNENLILPDGTEYAGKLQIKTEKSKYYRQDFNGNFASVSATVINTSTDTFYTNMGDFYGGIDQDNLLIAKGNDGYFEASTEKNSWEQLPLPLLIEGSKIIRILPSKKYILMASAFLDSSNFGRCRLRINYYKAYSKSGVDPLTDISNTFFVYK